MSNQLQKDIVWRIYLLYGFMLLAAFAIFVRIFQIQFVQGAYWKERSKEQSYKYVNEAAIRGNIFADDYSLLATSVPIYDVYWDAKVIEQKDLYDHVDSMALAYNKIFQDESALAFKNRILKAHKNKRRYYLLRKKVSYAELGKLQKIAIFKRGKYRGGLITEKFDIRKRPYKDLARRTIGTFNNTVNRYVVGLEGAYDVYLKGTDGVRIKQKTSGGWRPTYTFDKTVKEPVDGNDVVTSIDIELQDVAEESLQRELQKHRADWGCVVLMEVKTGKVKAIANLKADTAAGIYYEAYNYAIGAAMEPGSTFKLATMMAALEDGKVKPDDIISTGAGHYTYKQKTIHDSHDGGYGDITAAEVFMHSSNVGFFKIALNGYEKEPQKFYDRIYKMGIQKPLGIELSGESSPYIKNTKDKTWSRLSLPWMSIGYELRMTPLQILTFYNAVANDGEMVKPSFVNELSKTGKTIKAFDTKILNKAVCSRETAEILQKMMEGVVQSGTGVALKKSPYPVAGKTGTAQIYTSSYNKRNYQASFVGYFPADNPQYSCIVVVNNPSMGSYYAATVAVPVFKDIADKIYATSLNLQVHQKPDTIFQAPYAKVGQYQEIAEIYQHFKFKPAMEAQAYQYVATEVKSDTISFIMRPIADGLMPNLKNMSAKDAIFLLEDLGLKVQIVGAGRVVTQSLMPGTKTNKGQNVILNLQI